MVKVLSMLINYLTVLKSEIIFKLLKKGLLTNYLVHAFAYTFTESHELSAYVHSVIPMNESSSKHQDLQIGV